MVVASWPSWKDLVATVAPNVNGRYWPGVVAVLLGRYMTVAIIGTPDQMVFSSVWSTEKARKRPLLRTAIRGTNDHPS
jgi:hypothetical protein